MSLITASRFDAERKISLPKCACFASSFVASSSSVTPITPFIGVRISWLMQARNWLFRRFAPSAASRAWRIASAAARRASSSIRCSTNSALPANSISSTSAVTARPEARAARISDTHAAAS
jgi:hypothetical protein